MASRVVSCGALRAESRGRLSGSVPAASKQPPSWPGARARESDGSPHLRKTLTHDAAALGWPDRNGSGIAAAQQPQRESACVLHLARARERCSSAAPAQLGLPPSPSWRRWRRRAAPARTAASGRRRRALLLLSRASAPFCPARRCRRAAAPRGARGSLACCWPRRTSLRRLGPSELQTYPSRRDASSGTS